MSNGWGCTDFNMKAWDGVKVKYKKKKKEGRKEEKEGKGFQETIAC